MVELSYFGGECLQALGAQLMFTCGAEERRKRFLKQFVISEVRRQLLATDRSRIEELLFLLAAQPEERREAFEKFDIARRRVDAAFDFAPVAWVDADSLAKFAERQPLFDAQVFDEFVEHGACDEESDQAEVFCCALNEGLDEVWY